MNPPDYPGQFLYLACGYAGVHLPCSWEVFTGDKLSTRSKRYSCFTIKCSLQTFIIVELFSGG